MNKLRCPFESIDMRLANVQFPSYMSDQQRWECAKCAAAVVLVLLSTASERSGGRPMLAGSS